MSQDEIVPFNPLDKKNLGASVASALLEREPVPLGELQKFRGAGIYAVYYTGGFPAYEIIAAGNRNAKHSVPIYVGKAVPKGARKGSDLSKPAGHVLYNRLKEHERSIGEASNLRVEDFHCRYLVVDDIWIPLGETLLVATFMPLWNRLVDGFGNHDPGSGRHAGRLSRWDTLHPGRGWAEKCSPRKESAEQIIMEIEQYLRDNAHRCQP